MNPAERLKSSAAFFDKFSFVLFRISGFLLACCMVIVVADVIMRYVFGKPLIWVYYFSEYILVYSTFLAAAYVLKNDGHVRVDVIVRLLNDRQAAFIAIFTNTLGLLFTLILGFYSFHEVQDGFSKGLMFTSPVPVYQYPVKGVIPFGCLVLCVEWIRRLFSSLSHFGFGSPDRHREGMV